MGVFRTHRFAGLFAVAAVLAVALTAAVGVFGGSAGARGTRQVPTVKLLAMAKGSYEVSLGTTSPEWLPLSGRTETLTLIAGPPRAGARKVAADNAYVGFARVAKSCAATPGQSKSAYTTLTRFFTSAHGAAKHAGVFAPNSGASASTYIASAPGALIPNAIVANAKVRACIWLATTPGTVKKGQKKAKVKRSLVASIVMPVLNSTFAASVSNLTGATAGNGGYDMYAFDGGHAFRYSASSNLCSTSTTDGAATVPAGTPGSESVTISPTPCSTDASTFTFAPGGPKLSISYPVTDALTAPATTLAAGTGCELDPLVGASLASAEAYLTAVGCKLGALQVTPFQKSLPQGDVSWASVDGGVAEVAPKGSTVTLVLNGKPA